MTSEKPTSSLGARQQRRRVEAGEQPHRPVAAAGAEDGAGLGVGHRLVPLGQPPPVVPGQVALARRDVVPEAGPQAEPVPQHPEAGLEGGRLEAAAGGDDPDHVAGRSGGGGAWREDSRRPAPGRFHGPRSAQRVVRCRLVGEGHLLPSPVHSTSPQACTPGATTVSSLTERQESPMSVKPQLDGEVFYPTAEVVAQARVKDWNEVATRAADDLEGFWAKEAEELEWYRKWDKVLDRSNAALLQVVHGLAVQHRPQRARPAPALVAQEQALADLGGRARRGPHLLVLRAQPRRLQVRQRPQGHGREEGRPGHHLHAAHPRDRHRHAGLRQDRRGPLGGLRRLHGRRAAGAHRGLRVEGGASPPTAAS